MTTTLMVHNVGGVLAILFALLLLTYLTIRLAVTHAIRSAVRADLLEPRPDQTQAPVPAADPLPWWRR